ncbi:MAG: tryptophan synthase subunit alpha [Bacteroidota bacterium]|nr:tryptophan synthase subunit alpha [Bacteroidota bacterium]
MNRLNELFQRKQKNILNVYCTAGYPRLHDTLPIMRAVQAAGADIIELGMPYSDPLADGPVIQQSSSIALANGMTIAALFDQLKDFRKQVQIPVILMGYMNPVLQFGFEKFCRQAADLPVDGLILPDLPEREFETEYGPILQRYGLNFTFLVTPETSEERVRRLDALSSGFLYAVSSSSTTGSSKNMQHVTAYLERLRSYQLKNPILVGFGIHDKASFNAACEHANGAIIGTAFIKALDNSTDPEGKALEFVNGILK